MAWQDYILTIGTILFIVALIPSVFSKDKPAFTTSLLTGSVLAVFAFVYLSLSLWLTTITVSITSLTWLILAYQKYKINKSKSKTP